MKYAFHGAFAPYIYGLIEKKRSLGYDYYESERILRTFDEFCLEQFPCETHLTAKIVMRWAEQTGTEQNLFRLNRVSVIRELARHMNSVGCQENRKALVTAGNSVLRLPWSMKRLPTREMTSYRSSPLC